MTTVKALLRRSQLRLVRHRECLTYPIAAHHVPRWESICSGELGLEFVNATHAAFEFRGPLHMPALRDAVRLLVERHSILASRVVDTSQGPQFVFSADQVNVHAIDLSAVAAADRRALAMHTAGELIWRPWAGSTEAWFRPFVISLGPLEHVIGFVVHHFICDGWSTDIIKRDLLALYAAHVAGKLRALAELPLGYGDYVMSMNEWIASGAADSSAAYWRDQLRNAPATQVPPDFDVDPNTTGQLVSQSCQLPATAVARLRNLSSSRRLLMNAVVLAALAASVAHLSGATDIIIVSRISGRTQPALLGLVGAFFDSAALRVSVSTQMAFGALAEHVQRILADSYQHHGYPYQLVKSSLPSIGASAIAPMLNFIEAHAGSGYKRATRIRPFTLPPAPVTTPTAGRYNGFHTTVRLDNAGLHATTEYLDVLYRDETAARFVRTLCRTLDVASEQPHLRLATLFEM